MQDQYVAYARKIFHIIGSKEVTHGASMLYMDL